MREVRGATFRRSEGPTLRRFPFSEVSRAAISSAPESKESKEGEMSEPEAATRVEINVGMVAVVEFVVEVAVEEVAVTVAIVAVVVVEIAVEAVRVVIGVVVVAEVAVAVMEVAIEVDEVGFRSFKGCAVEVEVEHEIEVLLTSCVANIEIEAVSVETGLVKFEIEGIEMGVVRDNPGGLVYSNFVV